MTEELPVLLSEHRRLLLEESIIVDLLRKVRDEMHKIQIEQLQLDSMIMAEERKEDDTISSITTTTTATTDMDSAEKVNCEELDLNVTNTLTSMMEGQYYTEDMEEEEEEEDEDDDEGVPDKGEFFLSL